LNEAENSFETQEKNKEGEFWISVKIMTHWTFLSKIFYIISLINFPSKIHQDKFFEISGIKKIINP